MKTTLKRLAFLALVTLLFGALFCFPVSASEPIDEIQNFFITADMLEDGSVKFTYHIDWKVLDDDEFGPLEWVNIGVPNAHHSNITALTSNIDHIEDNGTELAIYFVSAYEENQIATFEFSFEQSHLYQIDKFTSGETVYSFTPAWFDEINVKYLTIKWQMDAASAWQPDAKIEGDYLVWDTSLLAGDSYTVGVTYPNDAFAFDVDNQYTDEDDSSYYADDTDDVGSAVLGFFVVIFAVATVSSIRKKALRALNGGSGFGGATEKKIVRTKIEYFDTCPGCGAARQEGKEACEFCGKSLIKKKEVVEETEIEHPENYTKDGTYRYGDSGNTFIHVNVVSVPRSHSHFSGGSGGSSCACVSSCACACVSSCACACACASSGRAGCSVKDFFDEEKHNDRTTVHAYKK